MFKMSENHKILNGKKVAISGSTGGIGRELCHALAAGGAELITVDRNPAKAQALAEELEARYGAKTTRLTADMESTEAVWRVTDELVRKKPDILILNAGAYHIPRHACDSGYDNILQINFISPYCMARRLSAELPSLKTVAVGSLAHAFTRIDENDIENKSRKGEAKAYGNAKRLLMLALTELFSDTPKRLSIAHPGISPTGITQGYPRAVRALIKYPMRMLFSSPQRAMRAILLGAEAPTPYGYWVGPAVFGIWGKPKFSQLKAASTTEAKAAYKIAEEIFRKLKGATKTVEIWDAYDSEHNKIEGMTLTRGEPVPNGIYHLVSGILVRHDDGTYLLMQRDKGKSIRPCAWQASAGGSAFKGEDALTCAKRELFEECGITPYDIFEIGTALSDRSHTFYVEFFALTDCPKDSVILQAGETMDYRWVTLEELESMDASTLMGTKLPLSLYEEKFNERKNKP